MLKIFASFFFLSEERGKIAPRNATLSQRRKKQVRPHHLNFLFSNSGTLKQCAMRTFLQKYSPIARIFGMLGARWCLCIHFYKNAHTHSHFRGVGCGFCVDFLVCGLDNVSTFWKREHELFPKETPNYSFTAIVPTIAVKEVFAQLFSKKRVLPLLKVHILSTHTQG